MSAATAQSFVKEILALRRKAGPIYGDNVMPAIRRYKELKDPLDRKAFQDALELLLTDPNEETRTYGVTLCLGFFVFRDAV